MDGFVDFWIENASIPNDYSALVRIFSPVVVNFRVNHAPLVLTRASALRDAGEWHACRVISLLIRKGVVVEQMIYSSDTQRLLFHFIFIKVK